MDVRRPNNWLLTGFEQALGYSKRQLLPSSPHSYHSLGVEMRGLGGPEGPDGVQNG